MRNKLISLVAILFAGMIGLHAQDYIMVSGYVTDEYTGDPVPGHEVNISADSAYASTVLTNEGGYYTDTISPATNLGFVYISTIDNCSYLYHDTTINNPDPNSYIFADFEICNDTTGGECQADFTYTTDSSNAYEVFFWDASTSATDIVSWSWQFGDGNGSYEQNPIHMYNSPGTYAVCLSIVSDGGDCESTYCMDVVVGGGSGSDCQVDFYYYADSLNQHTIQFFDQSDPAGEIVSWFWDFGNGSTSTEQNPMHTFGDAGNYVVCLTIQTAGADSCTSIACQDVLIQGSGGDCQADFYFVVDSTGSETTVSFFDQSVPAEAIDSWFWEFGDGTTSTEQNPVHTYNTTGNYNVCLTIAADSCTSTECKTVVLQSGGGDCQADFTYYADSTDPHLIYFVDLSTPADSIYDWYWEFGDGTSSTEQNPSHLFGDAGTYQVCLSINNTIGVCMDTYCMEIVVGTPAGCQADFYYIADSTDSQVISFFDQSSPAEAIDSWYWEFGDGNSSNEQNPVYTYATQGTFNACLTIVTLNNEDSCISTYCEDVVIQNLPMYYMGGNTFAGMYQLDDGFAYAYQYDNGSYTEVYSQVMDSLGYYLFSPFEGSYHVKVEPMPSSAYYNTYMPTYYGDVIHWEEAQMISLNQNIFNADINLVEMAVTIPGTGVISGHIFHQNGSRDDNPASDIQIMLADESGNYVGMIFSDESGYFEFDALSNGTFTIYAEVMGKSMVPKNFTLSDEIQHVDDVVMVIGENDIVFGIEDVASQYLDNISDIYPNPVSSTIKIDVEMKEASRLEFRVLSLTGQTMLQQQFDMSNSESIELNTSDLNAGMYLLEIITEDAYKVSKRFVKY